jgi:hypothetical protein
MVFSLDQLLLNYLQLEKVLLFTGLSDKEYISSP